MFWKGLCLIAVLGLINAATFEDISRQGSRNTYTLYTSEDIRLPFPITTKAELDGSPFKPNYITVIIVHDYEGSGVTTINPYLKDEILENDDEVNVFVVDWSTCANMGYNTAAAAVPSIAKNIAEFRKNVLTDVKDDDIHLIGFGLGAHICGIVGRDLGKKIARITGLDPAGKLWGAGSMRLSKDDAKFVEVIHTDGKGISPYGIGTELGHVDFFINGGGSQPGCYTHKCSHNRAWEIMAATMKHEIKGNRCNSMLQNNLNLCRGVTLEVGTNNINKRGSGIYRAKTRRSYPYV